MKPQEIDVARKFKKNRNKVLNELWLVLVILRCLGKKPLTKTNQNCSYTWRSFSFFYCLILTGIYIFIWSATIATAGLQAKWFDFILRPSTTTAQSIMTTSSPVVNVIVRSYFVLQPLSYIVDFTLPWLSLKQTLMTLNRWNDFQSYYETAISDHEFYPLEFSLRKSRTRSIIWAAVPSALGIFILSGQDLTWNPVVNTIWSTLLSFSMTFVPFMEDVMLNLHYKAVEQSFHLIRNRIRDFPTESVTSNITRGWTKLVLMLREQHQLICKANATHQLISTFLTLILLTMYIFILMHCLTTDLGPETSRVMSVCILYTFINSARVYCKCVSAERVTNEEQLLAQDLIPMIVCCNDMLTKIELRFLHDMIVNQPTKVIYGVITFNKGFMLSMISQIITYLVIVIQFNVSLLVDKKNHSD